MSKIQIEIDTEIQQINMVVDGVKVENVCNVSGWFDDDYVSFSFDQFEGDYKNGVRTSKTYTGCASVSSTVNKKDELKGFMDAKASVVSLGKKLSGK